VWIRRRWSSNDLLIACLDRWDFFKKNLNNEGNTEIYFILLTDVN
jgi:hypothetical protein